MTTVVFCGGHLAPALAVIEKLLEKGNYNIYYVGRKEALEGDSAESLEYNTLSKLNISFNYLITGRIQRSLSFHTIPSLLKLPIGFIQSFQLLSRIKPKVIISFGGYVAFPLCLSAWLLRIPIITHEQTHILGLANKIISKISEVLCLTFENTENVPSGVKTLVTGNPIRESIKTSLDEQIISFGNEKLPLLYVTGGSLGSKTINETVATIIPTLCIQFRILHQCGNAHGGQDFKKLSLLKDTLSRNSKNNYQVIEQVMPASVGSILKASQIVIGRAGANTVYELMTVGVAAILIPLPWAGQNEQEKNASLMKSAGLGEIILQSELTSVILLNAIENMHKKIHIYQKAKLKANKIVKLSGADDILQLIEKYSTFV